MDFSIIIPVYNEEEVISECHRRLSEAMKACDGAYELIFVNDGSRDRTMELARAIAEDDAHVKLISFSRNFGHQPAITAGMDMAAGRAVIVIDADLQDPPEVIPAMIAKWREGYEVVYGRRVKRKGETVFKRLTAMVFYRMLNSLTEVDLPVDAGDFRLLDHKAVEALHSLPERNRYVRGLVSWVGFRQAEVEYVREERLAGVTKYPLRRMLRFATDALTSFSHKPLKISIYFGTVLSLFSFIFLIVVFYQALFTDRTEAGWASLAAISLFFNGIVLIILGVIGEYIGRIYDEAKARPLYIIGETVGFDKGD